MTFLRDRKKRRAVNRNNGAIVYPMPFSFDSMPGLGRYRYERGRFTVDFEVLPVPAKGFYRWRGEQREGRFDSISCVIEPTLRTNFFEASERMTGSRPTSKDYEKFRKQVQEALLTLIRSRAQAMGNDPNFELLSLPEARVVFVQRFDQLRADHAGPAA